MSSEKDLDSFYRVNVANEHINFGFSQKETGGKSVAMATTPTQKVSFCFFFEVHFWCQV